MNVVNETLNSKILNKLKKLTEATNNQIETYLLDRPADYDYVDYVDYIENNALPMIWFDSKGEVIYSNKSMNYIMKSKIKGTNMQDRCMLSHLINKYGEIATICDEEGQSHKFKVYSKLCDCRNNKRINQCLLLPLPTA